MPYAQPSAPAAAGGQGKGAHPQDHAQDDMADCLDAAWRAGKIGISDEKALRVMKKASGSQNLEAFLYLPDRRREGTLAWMRKAGA